LNLVCSAGEVCLTGALHGYRRKRPGFAGSVRLDETRERDVLARSRLAFGLRRAPSALPVIVEPVERKLQVGQRLKFPVGQRLRIPVQPGGKVGKR
jgi:hypothetical protein